MFFPCFFLSLLAAAGILGAHEEQMQEEVRVRVLRQQVRRRVGAEQALPPDGRLPQRQVSTLYGSHLQDLERAQTTRLQVKSKKYSTIFQ